MNITVFIPCYIDACYPGIGVAMVTLLQRLGHQVDFRPQVVCCGQPAFNAGCWDDARRISDKVIKELNDAEVVVIPSGSCTAMMTKFYPELYKHHKRESEALSLSRRCYEFSSFLIDVLGVEDVGASFPYRVTFHDGCHGLRELGIKSAPRKLLSAVRGLELIEMEDAEVCCGFGGSFSVKFPAISSAMGEQKIASAGATDATYIVSNDVSCLMHIAGLARRKKNNLKMIHLAEVLSSQ